MTYDVVVIGAGHAGSEAGLIAARKGCNTLLLCINLDSVGFLACNPSIGGTAKGQLAAEIDALGGEMGINADKSALQYKMLNSSKGFAVQSLRAQVDKFTYHHNLKQTIENTKNLHLKQGEATEILVENGKVTGVKLATGEVIETKTVVVATGVYLNSRIIMGEYTKEIGPNGFASSLNLAENLKSHGIEIRRFKTGTPCRVDRNTIDFSELEREDGEVLEYGFCAAKKLKAPRTIPCYLTYTNKNTHKIILDNLSRAPMYSGEIKGIGPRYCPSIEDKVVRFSDRERHQLFLEPEGENTSEVYIQGLSTSMPVDLQEKIVKSVKGLENSFIMRNAYAIEYYCINPQELNATLEHKNIEGLFFAGQINGTSGYEEAGAQGIVAGINAAQKIKGEEPLIIGRDEAYIGVLIDDLILKGTNEPYRMMTSRAEHRLFLRQNNADLRLFDKAKKFGFVSKEREDAYNKKVADIKTCEKLFNEKIDKDTANSLLKEESVSGRIVLRDLVKRSSITFSGIKKLEILNALSEEAIKEVFINNRYEGYLKREKEEIEKFKQSESIVLPQDLDYTQVTGLKTEAALKLNKIKPYSLGQASRISGVSPADISVLTIYLKVNKLI